MHLATGADCTRWNNLALGWQDFSTASGLSQQFFPKQIRNQVLLASRHLAWDAYLANSKPSDKAMPTIVHNSAWFRAEPWLMQSHVNSYCAKMGKSMTRPELRQPINYILLETWGWCLFKMDRFHGSYEQEASQNQSTLLSGAWSLERCEPPVPAAEL